MKLTTAQLDVPLPCPFCGGKPLIEYDGDNCRCSDDTPLHRFHCLACGCAKDWTYDSENPYAAAIESWNARVKV